MKIISPQHTAIGMIATTLLLCWLALASCARGSATGSSMLAESPDTTATLWSDTLTNEASTREALAPLDRDIERFVDRWELAGLSVAVTRNDSLVFAKGYGWADREQGVAMQPTTTMRIASASKLITAAAIMKLREEHRLSLDDRVFGPEGILSDASYSQTAVDKRVFDITVDQLLMHKGGFTLGAGDPMFNTADIIETKRLDEVPDNNRLVEIVLGRRLGFTPGAGRRYSNFGYMLLSLIIERVTGRTYWEYVDSELLRPAGAYHFHPASNYYANRSADEARYYGPDTVKVKEYNGSGRMVERVYGGYNVSGLSGAGGWATSAPDLARFVAAIDGASGVRNILSRESIGMMTAYDPDDKQARGWSDADSRGVWSRTGTLSSSHVSIIRFDDGECWVLMTNSGVWTGFHFTHDLETFARRLHDRHSAALRDGVNLWR